MSGSIKRAPTNPPKPGTSGGSNTNSNPARPPTFPKLETAEFKADEKKANESIMRLKQEVKDSYKNKSKGDFRYGGRFLHNREKIHEQRLFRVAQKAPKGAHLHIHLNACLGPEFLLNLAASEKLRNNMYISVDLQDEKKAQDIRNKREAEKKRVEALNKQNPGKKETANPIKNTHSEPLTNANIGATKFQFHFLPYGWKNTCSVFSPNYCGRIEATEKAEGGTYDVMKFTDFLRDFGTYITKPSGLEGQAEMQKHNLCMKWLIKKLVFQPGEVTFSKSQVDHTKKIEPAAIKHQWNLFNTRTQMMKGLFLAEHAYREYLKALFDSFDKDNIQYAELRPNFMAANSVIRTSDDYRKRCPTTKKVYFDPNETMDNAAIMDMIIEEFKGWKKAKSDAKCKTTFKSMKVIICTPRSRPYPTFLIERTLEEAYEMKKNPKYSNWIAGFDFVGPETDGRSLYELDEQFQQWKDRYARIGLRWILHCGESFYDYDTKLVAKDRDEKKTTAYRNIKYALDNLNPKRLAHGYAIPNAGLSQEHKKRLEGTCIETCPDSNEALGLAYDASCAAVYPLQAMGIPCSVSCDNPTLFNSTLADEFYQVMVGKDSFDLSGWRKLMEHSLKHSVWNGKEDPVMKAVFNEWEAQYIDFIDVILKDFSGPPPGSKPSGSSGSSGPSGPSGPAQGSQAPRPPQPTQPSQGPNASQAQRGQVAQQGQQRQPAQQQQRTQQQQQGHQGQVPSRPRQLAQASASGQVQRPSPAPKPQPKTKTTQPSG